MKRLWPLLILLALACSKDKATNYDGPDPGPGAYEVYVYNNAGDHPARFTINNRQYSLVANQSKRIGTFSGVCRWEAERVDGYHGNYSYHRIGSGDVTIDHNCGCYIYENHASWR